MACGDREAGLYAPKLSVWAGLDDPVSAHGRGGVSGLAEGLGTRLVKTALVWFLVQLALNAAWTPVFFGLHRIDVALLVIVLLWAAIVVTMYYYFRVSRSGGLLLVPYLLWVSFATVLNASIWHLNR